MVEHVTIADADRHEVKHASTALSGQVLKSTGGGVTAFSFLTYAELQGKPTVSSYTDVLRGQSFAASQQPSVVGTPLQVEFGPLQTTPNATLASSGELTFNVAGQYIINLFLHFGRSTAVGDAYLFARTLIDGVQVYNSTGVRLGSQDVVIPFTTSVGLTVAAGQVLTVQILRDAAGINNGGLTQLTPSVSGWSPAPSATMVVSKFVGLT